MANLRMPAVFLAGAATAWCLSQVAAYAWEDDGADADQTEEEDTRVQAQPQRPVGGADRVQARSTEQLVAASAVTETFHVQLAGVAQGWDINGFGTVQELSATGAVVIVPAEGESHCRRYLVKADDPTDTSSSSYKYTQDNSKDYPWTPRAWMALAMTAQVSGKRLRVYDVDGDCTLGVYFDGWTYYSDIDSIMLSD